MDNKNAPIATSSAGNNMWDRASLAVGLAIVAGLLGLAVYSLVHMSASMPDGKLAACDQIVVTPAHAVVNRAPMADCFALAAERFGP